MPNALGRADERMLNVDRRLELGTAVRFHFVRKTEDTASGYELIPGQPRFWNKRDVNPGGKGELIFEFQVVEDGGYVTRERLMTMEVGYFDGTELMVYHVEGRTKPRGSADRIWRLTTERTGQPLL